MRKQAAKEEPEVKIQKQIKALQRRVLNLEKVVQYLLDIHPVQNPIGFKYGIDNKDIT